MNKISFNTINLNVSNDPDRKIKQSDKKINGMINLSTRFKCNSF